MVTIGFFINPIAGIGGRVGLKGSDGIATQERARELGALPEAGRKAEVALIELTARTNAFRLLTYGGAMGADTAAAAGVYADIVGSPAGSTTTQEDSRAAATALRDAGADLILFAGGDGTARDVMDAVEQSVPVLGIPAGCKIHSAVYAINPRMAGTLVADFVMGKINESRLCEVMDIDEDLFRRNIIDAKLYGYMMVPVERNMVQGLKSGRSIPEAGQLAQISHYVFDGMDPGMLYIVGPGSTTFHLLATQGITGTLLGVDLLIAGELIATDVTEQQILEALKQHPLACILVTIIGGQGYVFGRGNQQISAQVIRAVGKDQIMIVASKTKVAALVGHPLLVDTGDEATNEYLHGYYRVVVGYGDIHMMSVSS